jgi:hypothetical protein
MDMMLASDDLFWNSLDILNMPIEQLTDPMSETVAF